MRTVGIIALLVCTLATSATAQTWTISETGQTIYPLSAGGVGADELSGLTWAGGNQYYTVSDNGGRMFPLTINIDANTGKVTSATVAPAVSLAAGVDVEGIAYDAMSSTIFISDESGPAIREHNLDGSLVQTAVLPPVFATHRSNLSLESLSRQAGGSLWTANEEALTGDGPVSSFSAGSVVRLQKLDATLSPIGQWAYVTDAISGDISNNGRDVEVSGIADLVALPDGGVLVLERALGAMPFGFRLRIYSVDFAGATDVSALPALAGQTFTPVGKTLLHEVNAALYNLEGIALGPQLADGSYSLLLISDNGGGLAQGIRALRILPPFCDPAPRAGCRTSEHSNLKFRRVNGVRDRLTWNWRGGVVQNLADYGDPVTPGGTVYALCVYDSAAAAPTFAWGARLLPGLPWSTGGDRGFRYRDKTAAAYGINSLQLRTGDGNARIVVRGKGVQLQLPDNGSNPMLTLDTTVTVQLVDVDDPARCFTATYSTAQESTADQFKARY